MARGKTARKRRRRKGRYAFFYRVLSLLLICGAIVAAMILFFKVESIEVEGNVRYSDREIIQVSGVQQGDNLLLLNKYQLSGVLYGQLPYISAVQIRRAFPSGLVIQVEECAAAAGIEQADGVWLINSAGKLLEKTERNAPRDCPLVTGCTLLMPTAGEELAMPESESQRQTQLLQLVQALEQQQLSRQIEKIDFSQSRYVILYYGQRFTVYVPWNTDYAYKMRYLTAVIEKLEENEQGVIDLTQADGAHFIPD